MVIKMLSFFFCSQLSFSQGTDHVRYKGVDSGIICEYYTGEIIYEGVNLVHLAQIMDQWRTVVKHK